MIRKAILVAWLLFNHPHASVAQVVIPDRIACPECRIELEETQRIGDRSGHELFDDVHMWIVRDRLGDLWVPNMSVLGTIQVYAPDGTYREVSRPGQGPGEFGMVNLMGCLGDGVMIFDHGRFSLIDPASDEIQYLSLAPEVGFQRGAGVIQVRDSVLWLSSPSRAAERLGVPIMQVNPFSGEVVRAFGKTVDHYDQLVELHTMRQLAKLPDDRVVSVGMYAYELEIWSADGKRLGHFIRDAPWFRPQMERGVDVTINGVHALDENRVAVLIAERTAEVPFETADPRPLSERWSGTIEVLDLSEGKVLARLRGLPFFVGTVCPTGEVAGLVKNRGQPVDHLRLFRLSLALP